MKQLGFRESFIEGSILAELDKKTEKTMERIEY